MNKRLRSALQQDMSRRTFWGLVALVVLVKLLMTRFQTVYVWVGGAPLDDELMFRAAQSITAGQWLGAYDWLTLSKHMFFAVWLAVCNLLHLPYLAAGQLLTCGAALACAFAFAPVLRRWKSRFALFALLTFSPAATASFTLRVYRDNIFPGLCMLFFAGMCGYALRCRRPVKQSIGWLVLSGVGLGLAWLTREDGVWLLPFAAAGTLILILTALRDKGSLAKKLGRCALLAVPYGLLAAAILVYSAVNYACYGLFAVSDFSTGSFAAAVGAMSRVKAEEWKPLCSVPTDVRMKLYDAVPELKPLEYWLEEDENLQNSFRNPELDDYQSGSFYWALRKAAWNEGMYDSPQKAEEYWQQVADAINALCDSGQLEANGPKRSSTTPPIRLEYVPDVLVEGVRSLLHTLTFRDCAPYYADQRSLILRCKTGITRVELDKLEYCEVIRRSLLLHKTDGTVLEAAGSMDSLCESLTEHRNFLRIHRSYLVNLEHIQTITPKTLIMSSRAELPIPRGRYNDIKDAYLEHAFQKEQVFLT